MTDALHDGLYPLDTVAAALRLMARSRDPDTREAVREVAYTLTRAQESPALKDALNERGRRDPWANTARQVAEARAGREAAWPDNPALQAQHGGPDTSTAEADAAEKANP